MKFDTSTLRNDSSLSAFDKEQIYNGLDCCVTFEVFEELSKIFKEKNDPSFTDIYNFERGLQAPAIDMMLRGWKIDNYERSNNERLLSKQLERLENILNRYSFAVWGKGLNARSSDQLKAFFYGAMGIPEVIISFKGIKRVSCNREALEKVSEYFYALPIVKCIFAIRDVSKLLSVLRTEISPDGRMRTSYNIAGTETGRWSSSKSVEGTGTNLQNITPELRKMFVADEGKKLIHIDLEQAESRVVGLIFWSLFNDRSYLDAHESGDLHTTNAMLLWPDLVHDKSSAETFFYLKHSYRDMSKRGGHLSNYRGTSWMMSRALHIPIALAESFQEAYYGTYPSFERWYTWCARQIQLHSTLTTPLGRQRVFFGRDSDDAIIREAIAYIPQSTVADTTNTILWRVWKEVSEAELLGQTHDSIDFQCEEDAVVETIDKVREISKIEITWEGKSIVIPVDIATGWNWAPQKYPFTPATNPNGLMKWSGQDDRKRVRGLDRLVA
jgi:DNA polymerase-1